MNAPLVRAYVIGQTPRPDLTSDLERRFPSVSFEVLGALDGLAPAEVQACDGCPYPLETRLRDGTRVIIDASYVAGRMQGLLDADRGEAAAHLVLCAGPFPELSLPATDGRVEVRLLRPFEVAVERFRARGLRRLEIAVPFGAQAAPALAKWAGEGFEARPHVLAERPSEMPLAEWLAGQVPEGGADAVVFDYVGYPSDALSEVAGATGLPVFDLGHMALDALHDTLAKNTD